LLVNATATIGVLRGLQKVYAMLLLATVLLLDSYVLLTVENLIYKLGMVVEQREALIRTIQDLRDVLIYLIP
jgi:hypothetical protein